MLESVAKTKWCHAFTASHTDPRAREYVAADGAFDANATGPFRHHCLGSECMAWRWSNAKMGHDLDYQINTHGRVEGEKRWAAYQRENPPQGFCGLAGAST